MKNVIVFSYTHLHRIFLSSVLKGPEFVGARTWFFMTTPSSGRMARIVLVAKFFWLRLRMLIGSDDFILLLPHPDQMLANYFFYRCKAIEKTYVYEDGLMLYRLGCGAPALCNFTCLKKRLASFLLFYCYTRVQGNLAGLSSGRVNGVYAQYPERLIKQLASLDLQRIHIAKKLILSTSNEVIFLDQDIESMYGGVKARRVREYLYSKLCGFETVWVKLHPSRLSTPGIVKGLPPNFKVLDALLQDSAVEALVEHIKPSQVWGVSSAALININNFFAGVTCHSVTSADHRIDGWDGEVSAAEFFGAFGVESVGV